MLCAPCNLRKGATIAGDAPLVPLANPLLEAARSLDLPIPGTIADVHAIVDRLIELDPDQAIALAWALDAHLDTPRELRRAIAELMSTVEGDDARLFALVFTFDDPVPELKRLAHSAVPAVAARAAAEACLMIEDDEEAMRYARQAREQATDVMVQAAAARVIGEYSEDDDEWRTELLFAHEHGNPWTRARAALALGEQSGDDATAYRFLEEVTRSPAKSLAVEAAAAIEKRFANDPQMAERYKRMRVLLEEQLDS